MALSWHWPELDCRGVDWKLITATRVVVRFKLSSFHLLATLPDPWRNAPLVMIENFV